VLGDIPLTDDPRVLVDYRTADDAGVYKWAAGPALVQTVDFFTPVVDDPYHFGQIAAANALSDVYAMGGEPRTALAIAALPKDGPGLDVIKAIFRGGHDKLREAGVVLLGGHTVTDTEIKFGYAITGEIDPARVLTNASARAGNVLVLTKPLGTGIIATAIKFGRASQRQIDAATESMTRLNRDAAEVVRALPPGMVTAATDITGFGLAGHGSEMAAASGVTLAIDAAALPLLEGAIALAPGNTPGGNKTNDAHFGSRVSVAASVPAAIRLIAFDPQTSGGLLLAIDATAAAHALGKLAEAGVQATVVGRVEPPDAAGTRLRLNMV
jgi:selenide, water dikinase